MINIFNRDGIFNLLLKYKYTSKQILKAYFNFTSSLDVLSLLSVCRMLTNITYTCSKTSGHLLNIIIF